MTQKVQSKSTYDDTKAFPGPRQHAQHVDINEGMTLRDYFAAQALQGELNCQANEDVSRYLYKNEDADNRQNLADWYYLIADAMMEARKP